MVAKAELAQSYRHQPNQTFDLTERSKEELFSGRAIKSLLTMSLYSLSLTPRAEIGRAARNSHFLHCAPAVGT